MKLFHLLLFQICVRTSLQDSDKCEYGPSSPKRRRESSQSTASENKFDSKLEDLLESETELESGSSEMENICIGGNISVKSYNESQKELAIQNAIDLFSDIMRCSLFCFKELIAQTLTDDKVLLETSKSIYQPVLERKILSFYLEELSQLLQSPLLYDLESKYVGVIKKEILIFEHNHLKNQFADLYLQTPKLLRNIFPLQFKLLEIFGITEHPERFIEKILTGSIMNGDILIYRNLLKTVSSLLSGCFTNYLSLILIDLRKKSKKVIENKNEAITPFDVTNLMAHGADRIEWVHPLSWTLSRLSKEHAVDCDKRGEVSKNDSAGEKDGEDNSLSKESTRDNSEVNKEMTHKIIRLVEQILKHSKSARPDLLFQIYLNEKHMNRVNQQIFSECQRKLHQILTKMVNHSLNYYQNKNTLVNLPN